MEDILHFMSFQSKTIPYCLKQGLWETEAGNIKGGFRISCMTTDNFCFYLQNKLIQTSQKEVNSTVILPPLVFPD